jgi:very-short-patch-repair endonuclease
MIDYKECLFYNASPEIHQRAKELRKNMTPAEKVLWKHIRNRKFGKLKFRRQHPIDIFIADFYCHELKLVIEIDGGIHQLPEHREYDIGRNAEMNDMGIEVIRFTNEEVLNSLTTVLKKINETITGRKPYDVH